MSFLSLIQYSGLRQYWLSFLVWDEIFVLPTLCRHARYHLCGETWTPEEREHMAFKIIVRPLLRYVLRFTTDDFIRYRQQKPPNYTTGNTWDRMRLTHILVRHYGDVLWRVLLQSLPSHVEVTTLRYQPLWHKTYICDLVTPQSACTRKYSQQLLRKFTTQTSWSQLQILFHGLEHKALQDSYTLDLWALKACEQHKIEFDQHINSLLQVITTVNLRKLTWQQLLSHPLQTSLRLKKDSVLRVRDLLPWLYCIKWIKPSWVLLLENSTSVTVKRLIHNIHDELYYFFGLAMRRYIPLHLIQADHESFQNCRHVREMEYFQNIKHQMQRLKRICYTQTNTKEKPFYSRHNK